MRHIPISSTLGACSTSLRVCLLRKQPKMPPQRESTCTGSFENPRKGGFAYTPCWGVPPTSLSTANFALPKIGIRGTQSTLSNLAKISSNKEESSTSSLYIRATNLPDSLSLKSTFSSDTSTFKDVNFTILGST